MPIRRLSARPSGCSLIQSSWSILVACWRIKHIDVLIEAVTRINRQPDSKAAVEAVIIGSGPMQDGLEQQAGDNPAIKFLGQI